jgi:monothiol glutaredoxin
MSMKILLINLDILKCDEYYSEVVFCGCGKEYMIHIRFKRIVDTNRVVLFMKGTPSLPLCGLSATVYFMLKKSNLEFETIDLLQDPELNVFLRKMNSPACSPFLYMDGKLIGGYEEIMEKMVQKTLPNPK